MRRKIPSTNALIAFEAAARHESFSRAAAELSITEGAISRRIAVLEDYLGMQLFNRVKKRVSLTTIGKSYSRNVYDDLCRIEHSTISAMAHQDTNKVIELAVIPTFCNKWLIPRLAEFHKKNSEITINLSERSNPFLFGDTVFDAAIHFEHPAWAGTLQTPLFDEEVLPVCSPHLTGIKRCRKPDDLANYTLLHKTSREDMWPRWFEEACPQQHLAFLRGPRYDLFSMLIVGALRGLGVALVPHLYVRNELENGELIIPINKSVKGLKRYCLVYPEHKEMSPTLRSLVDFLVASVDKNEVI